MSSTSRVVVTVRLRSADGSRRVRNTVVLPGRRLICATWPSIHTQPSLATQAPIFWLTTRTGHGFSALDVVSGTRPLWAAPPTLSVARVATVARFAGAARKYHGG